ncbi:MAG: hypothetical protein U9N35_08370 [Euryarchaeota archaeon]|nr:hypothetical protein [Euryarchaeota archaeon]
MRVLEAFLASAIMVVGAMYISTEQAGTVEPPSPGEIAKMKQMGNDILSVLENNKMMYRGNKEEELALYIRTKDQYTLSERLKDIIPRSYTYEMKIYKVSNISVIPTKDEAIDMGATLSNGYVPSAAIHNYDDIWHYIQGGYTFDLPDIDTISATVLVVDSTNSTEDHGAFDYDACHLNFDTNNSDSFMDREDLPVNPAVPLKSRDFFRIYGSAADVQYELEMLVSKITPDGNSVSMGLTQENIMIDLDANMKRDYVSIMNGVYHFKVQEKRGRNVLYYDRDDPNDTVPANREYKGPYIEGEQISIESYDVGIEKITDEALYLSVFAYRKEAMSVSTLVKTANLVVCNKVLTVKEVEDTNFYYISLTLGRRS